MLKTKAKANKSGENRNKNYLFLAIECWLGPILADLYFYVHQIIFKIEVKLDDIHRGLTQKKKNENEIK